MAWYTTGTIAVSGTTVTGTGTNWTDNKQGIGPGQALLIPGAGTVKMYEIKSVDSATKLTLMSSAGTLAAGQAYAIMSFYTNSVPDFARRLAAQLSYYQGQMDGWQQLLTSTGTVTLTAPDGTSVAISSMSKLMADSVAAFKAYGLGVKNADSPAYSSPPISGTNVSETRFINATAAATQADTHKPIENDLFGGVHVQRELRPAQFGVSGRGASASFWYRGYTGASSDLSEWQKVYSQNNKPALTDLAGTLPVANGGTGQTSLPPLLSALGFSYYSPSALQMAIRIPYNGGSILIQTASVVVTTNVSAQTTISYPLTFTKLFNVMAMNGDNSGQANGDGMVSIINFSGSRLSSFDIDVQNRRSVPVRIHFIAIGA
ncbi:hypothetical protein CYR40_05455 [Chimaeribacter arupi]|uniref:Phage tail protein n=1 Tax=Nissabacter archeti TaxID=1917880 RepID=A0ABS5JCJ0_9GAMM|nr:MULTISPECIES: hypothetical protein [Yersiniaceae]MBS0967674.1 hypothetical protein [Nissabacter archeti]PLR48616.1 hypothetical protein CYR40_05455 [Chimaeribacter arupi]WKZ94126.1 hypothetical protein P0E69_09750 [Chimaeribacter arupi]